MKPGDVVEWETRTVYSGVVDGVDPHTGEVTVSSRDTSILGGRCYHIFRYSELTVVGHITE